MPRISSKVTVRAQLEQLKNTVIKIFAVDIAYEDLSDDNESSSEEDDSDNADKTSNWIDVTFREYMSWLGLDINVTFSVANHHFYWRTMQELTKPIMLLTFNIGDSLYSVCNFVNAFNSNLIELGRKNKFPGLCKIPCKPHPIGQEWKILADSFMNIIIQLEPYEDKEIEKLSNIWFGSPKVYIALMQNGLYGIYHAKKREWPLNYLCDMVQKLDGEYGSYFSKIALVNNVCLIVASLKD
ncbi:30353_t:CDS:2 [Gigaspora margarita]|uniref:30353_t:CDS:1 n=1 Tax=Gigaspora margarita TaxID=4874 RepID=A0ABN7VDP4_GIGMA|nr:30353_t:CDS:2 [Gigaspora margarita]